MTTLEKLTAKIIYMDDQRKNHKRCYSDDVQELLDLIIKCLKEFKDSFKEQS